MRFATASHGILQFWSRNAQSSLQVVADAKRRIQRCLDQQRPSRCEIYEEFIGAYVSREAQRLHMLNDPRSTIYRLCERLAVRMATLEVTRVRCGDELSPIRTLFSDAETELLRQAAPLTFAGDVISIQHAFPCSISQS